MGPAIHRIDKDSKLIAVLGGCITHIAEKPLTPLQPLQPTLRRAYSPKRYIYLLRKSLRYISNATKYF